VTLVRMKAPQLGCGLVAILVVSIEALFFSFGAPRASAAPMLGQVVTVEASASTSEVAVLRTWRLAADGRYVQVSGPSSPSSACTVWDRRGKGSNELPAGCSP